jgi:hypothetical protein
MIPKGCDQQGRHPEAAEAATEVGIHDEPPEQDMLRVVIDDVLIAMAAIGALCIVVLLVMGNL